MRYLSPVEVAFFYAIASLSGFVAISDCGLSPAFTRALSYAFSGAERVGLYRGNGETLAVAGQPNQELIRDIICTLRIINRRFICGLFFCLLFIATPLLYPLWEQLAFREQYVVAWCVVAFSFLGLFYGRIYESGLKAGGQLPQLRRWEGMLAVVTIISDVVCLVAGGGCALLLISHYGWLGMSVPLKRWLFRSHVVLARCDEAVAPLVVDQQIWQPIWQGAWRQGLGALFRVSILQGGGLIYMQFGAIGDSAAVLMALRLLSCISGFSAAPFVSHVPLFAKLQVQEESLKLIRSVFSQMAKSHWAFLIGSVIVGVGFQSYLGFVRSETQFIPLATWFIFAGGFFLSQVTQLHLLFYSVTNLVISHRILGYSFMVFGGAISIFAAVGRIEPLEIALCQLIPFLFVGVPGAVCRTRGRFLYSFLRLELRAFIPVTAILLALAVYFHLWK